MATGRGLLLTSGAVRDLELRVVTELGGLLFIALASRRFHSLFALWGLLRYLYNRQ